MKPKAMKTVYKLAQSFGIYPYAVDYAPGHEAGEFYLSSGDARNGNGCFLTAREALEPQWRRDLESAGALWLVPLLERIAGGEAVTAAQVLDAYRAQHGEKPESEQWPIG